MAKRCKDCKFWEPSQWVTDIDAPGTCCRFPPMLIQMAVRNFDDAVKGDAWIYPHTTEDEWCGEFKWINEIIESLANQ